MEWPQTEILKLRNEIKALEKSLLHTSECFDKARAQLEDNGLKFKGGKWPKDV